MKLIFTKAKDTKNKVRYEEEGDDQVVGTLYITKEDVRDLGNPEKVEVTINAC